MNKVLFALLTQLFLNHCESYRILNGNEVETITEFPYQVAIFARRSLGTSLSSGSILSEKFILTCAHCVINSTSVGIYYGITDLSQPQAKNYQSIDSLNYVIHPNYSSFRDDIALILTNHDIILNDKIQPVRLPLRSDTINYENRQLLMAAWGYYSNAHETSNILRYADMEMISSNECKQIFGEIITDKIICSKTLHCSGDSGALLVDRDENNEFVAIGIASFANYQTCTERDNHASAYMRISSYLDFIHESSNLNEVNYVR